ncbi:glycosyltransferase family 4 protein [Caulobacter sp. S45]|uniref:glycosyltransferase family 4 protein n=1 Tax=Caulobacter sp. S45 TaxID=1641861 RepID=UPI00131EC029|nr:glycosyltransferase family 4 protein [Caulobacter sp. S45]
MRILMACMKFPTAPGQSYLTTELAQALVAAGHVVEVLLIDWDAAPGAPDGPCADWKDVRVVRCTPRLIGGLGGLVRNASKFVLTGRRARRLARDHFDLERFDAFIAWTPVLAFGSCVGLARKAGVARRLLFIWDFFPDHYHEIGRIPGGPALWLARALEQRLMDQFNVLLCTLPQNADYLRRNFQVRAAQAVRVTPIWSDVAPIPDTDRSTVRRRHDLPQDRPLAVFGGQLVEGRGFDQMLAAAAVGRERGSPLLFLFVGDGRLAPMLSAQASDNVLWRPAMPREAYLQLLTACDVGMVATVPGVSSFTIPSKTLDYLRAGLPVVAALEAGNDFSALLERYGVGRAVPFEDPDGFFTTAEALAAGPSVDAAAQLCLEEVFHVRHAVASVLADL